MLTDMPKFVQSRSGDVTGRVVGHGRPCQLEGCRGWTISVRWPDGHLTRPCSKGMAVVDTDTWRIE